MRKAVGTLCQTKYCKHWICPHFCSTFSSGAFSHLFFEAKRKALSLTKRRSCSNRTFNTEELWHSQALLLPSCCIVSVYCYHLASPISVGLPAPGFPFVRSLEEQSQSCTCKMWSSLLPLKSTQFCNVILLLLEYQKGQEAAPLLRCPLKECSMCRMTGEFPGLLLWPSL